MFARIIEKKKGEKSYRYLTIVESYWEDGPRQRIIANLGNIERLGKEKVDHLIRSLSRFSSKNSFTKGDIEVRYAKRYGDVLLARNIFEKLNLSSLLHKESEGKKLAFSFEKAIFVLILNRLVDPCSKLSVVDWHKEEVYLEKEELFSYQHFLRAMDVLSQAREKIEQALYSQLVNLFTLKLNLVFYDLTSTYFEGKGPTLASFGYSRDRRPDKRQILLGLALTDDGYPIAHHLFSGNTADKSTLKSVVKDLERRFGIREVTFIGDRGLVSQENLLSLEKAGYHYILTLRKRASKLAKRLISAHLSLYRRIDEENLLVREVEMEGLRYLICHHPLKAEEDRSFRASLIERAQKELNLLKKQVEKGRLAKKEKIYQRAAGILSKRKAKKFFTLSAEEGFSFKIKENVIREEEILDGKFILITNNPYLSPEEIVKAYKNLSIIEDAFREIKNFLKIRPIYHYTERRVKSHVFICVLAFLLEKYIEIKLKEKGINLSARSALRVLSRVKLVENKVGDLNLKCITRLNSDQKRILSSMGIPHIPRLIPN